MEMGRLQYELDGETEKIHNKYYSGGEFVLLHKQPYEDTDSYKMLERAALRLEKGEKWDVAETLTLTSALTEHEGIVTTKPEWRVTDDLDAMTVGDILKTKGRSLMSSKTAAQNRRRKRGRAGGQSVGTSKTTG